MGRGLEKRRHRRPLPQRHADLMIACLIAVAAAGQIALIVDDLVIDTDPVHRWGAIGFISLFSLVAIGLMLYRLRRDARAYVSALASVDAALRESEQRSRRIYEGSPLGILLARSDDHRIVQANPALCRMLGYQAQELVGRTVDEITHPDDRRLSFADDEVADSDYSVEKRFITRAGGVMWARFRETLLRSPDGGETFSLGLTEDTTRQKRAEAELRQAQKLQAIGQLSGGIAHDFNNLLGVIIGNVEFLIDAVRENPTQATLANEILSSALGGADLTRRLLAFSRRQTLQPRRIDLNAYLPDHIAILRRVLGETIQITTGLAPDLWPIRADPSQIGDALLNLAINARDAMPFGGIVTIETANAHLGHEYAGSNAEVVAGDYAMLSVTDTGTGMTPEVLERVLEPFFTTKEPGSGSGLGLSIIYGFAQQSGGHLKIYSEPGRGTAVRLYLPRVDYRRNGGGRRS